MGLITGISWTDATWNPWQGCTKVSPACDHCYMFREMARYGKYGHIIRRSKTTFDLPLKKVRGAYVIPAGHKVFTCSWSDWFHKAADEWRDEAWEIIRQRPDVIFQIVTKRTDRIAQCLPADWGDGWPNVWLIATVENQEWADIRIPQLISVPAAIRGLSMEPLLGDIQIGKYLGDRWWCPECGDDDEGGKYLAGPKARYCSTCAGDSGRDVWIRRAGKAIHWGIVGGESGPDARVPWLSRVRSLRDQCVNAGIAFHLKQWGEWCPSIQVPAEFNDRLSRYQRCTVEEEGNQHYFKLGTTKSGRTLDGCQWDQFPNVKAVS